MNSDSTFSPTETFTAAERRILERYFTNVEGPVFALRNLPEVVKGALFARYSRSARSLRRLFLEEFLDDLPRAPSGTQIGSGRAERLYERVFVEYGDDSVAQLGGAHVACEGASNLLTKILEWGRLLSCLEQSTRYVSHVPRRGNRWKYLVPEEVARSTHAARYGRCLDGAFETYARWIPRMEDHLRRKHPRDPADHEDAYSRAIRARSLDAVRGLLPAATQSNVGLYGSGQAFEALLLRMQAHPLAEARHCARLMLEELRKVIPAFLRRVDQEDRGTAWSLYLAETRRRTRQAARSLIAGRAPEPRPEVVLCDFDPEGEIKVAASALYAASDLPADQCLAIARGMTEAERAGLMAACAGERSNRRHKPGRAFEATRYRFDILADYGAFRDLQRHRLLTLEWQPLTTRLGYVTPEEIDEAGGAEEWRRVMEDCSSLHEALAAEGLGEAASYAATMAHRIRFYMDMNAREAMHVIELRTSPQGHPSYRRICQRMHQLIAEQAGHRAIAAAMRFADHSPAPLGRITAERTAQRRREEGS